jgi:hypothetical protein
MTLAPLPMGKDRPVEKSVEKPPETGIPTYRKPAIFSFYA